MIVPLEEVLPPRIDPVRLRYVAGLSNEDGDPVYSVFAVTEFYDPASGDPRGRVSLATVIPSMTDEQARHLSIQLARATGLSAEHDIALGILKAQLTEAQDALRAITAMLSEPTDAE
jgi:hypothetical protein